MYYLTFQTATSHTLLYPVLRGGRLEGVCDSGCSTVQVSPMFAERTTAGFCCASKFFGASRSNSGGASLLPASGL